VNPHCFRCAITLLISVVTACSSAPIRYYTLIPPDATQAAPPNAATMAIDVRAVHTPAQLNRAELMIRTGPTEITLLENERWASPVKDEIRDAARLELQHRLAKMIEFSPLKPFGKLSVTIDVQRLEAELGRYALLEASWSANLSGPSRTSSDIIVKDCAFWAYEEIRGGYAGMVEGYQRETMALADAIASALASSGSGISVPCQSSSSRSE
jgi:uncharacterized lipoprotein YmbA